MNSFRLLQFTFSLRTPCATFQNLALLLAAILHVLALLGIDVIIECGGDLRGKIVPDGLGRPRRAVGEEEAALGGRQLAVLVETREEVDLADLELSNAAGGLIPGRREVVGEEGQPTGHLRRARARLAEP